MRQLLSDQLLSSEVYFVMLIRDKLDLILLSCRGGARNATPDSDIIVVIRRRGPGMGLCLEYISLKVDYYATVSLFVT